MKNNRKVPQWSKWRTLPDPRDCGILHAPFGPGVYELRRRDKSGKNSRLVLVGIGKRCALRMSSLLPKPYGAGTRNNEAKREYVLRYIRVIEYRTLPCSTREEAATIEREMLNTKDYLFQT